MVRVEFITHRAANIPKPIEEPFSDGHGFRLPRLDLWFGPVNPKDLRFRISQVTKIVVKSSLLFRSIEIVVSFQILAYIFVPLLRLFLRKHILDNHASSVTDCLNQVNRDRATFDIPIMNQRDHRFTASLGIANNVNFSANGFADTTEHGLDVQLLLQSFFGVQDAVSYEIFQQ